MTYRALAVLLLVFCCVAAAPEPPSFSPAGIDNAVDLHGDPCNARLVLFIGGNQWMAMPEIVAAFLRAHPNAGPVYYETLPPGILAKQLATGALRVGSLTISARADVFMTGQRGMMQLAKRGLVEAPVSYATNTLAIAVREGNPKHVASLGDLARPDVRVAMPNPRWEYVGRQILEALRKAGGQHLVNAVMVRKMRAGTTLLTQIHHRETPLWIEEGRADAGPLWITEARYQERIGAPVAMVAIPAARNVTATYQAAVTAQSLHAEAAREFVEFLGTSAAREIFRSYGFGPPPPITAMKEE